MSSAKRSASPGPKGAAAEGSSRASTRSKKNSNLNEDELANSTTDANALQVKQQKERAYWDQYETPLLAAWLVDYSVCKLKFATLVVDRTTCLDLLCSEEWVGRPAGKVDMQLQTLQQIWIKNRDPSVLLSIVPGRTADHTTKPKSTLPSTPASSSGVQLESLGMDMTDDEGKEGEPKKNLDSTFAAAAASSTPAASFSLVDHNANPVVASKPIAPPAPIIYMECRTCCTPKRTDRPMWICSCGLRGDLSTSDHANVHLAAINIEKLRNESAVAAALAAASSSGKSSSDSDSSIVAASALDALDKIYAAELKVGAPYPLFTGPTAQMPITAVDALNRSREAAYNGLAYHPPSDQLVALIQSGKFWKVGHAIPRPLVYSTEGDDGATAFMLSGTGLIAKSKIPPPPNQCDSVSSFAEAFFSTIGPALIDRPEALLNWMTLGRTALEISRTHPWSEAATYISQHLLHATAQRQPIMKTNQTIISTIPPSYRTAAAAAHRPGQQPATNAASPAISNNCWDWNQERCTREKCQRRHVCSRCTGNHAAVVCPTNPIQRVPLRAPGSGSGGDRRPHRDDSSVRTKQSSSTKVSVPAKTE